MQTEAVEPPDDVAKKKTSFFKKLSMFIGISCVVFLITAAGLTYYSINYFQNPGSSQEDKTLVIANGSSLKSIAYNLSNAGIIKHPELFYIILRVNGAGNSLKAGEYSFPAGISPVDAFEKLANADVIVHKITIPEGLMTFQILKHIQKAEYMTGAVPENIREGTLLPETYDYYYGDSREKLVKRMQNAMIKALNNLWEKREKDSPIKNKKELLTLASIVEKETGIPEERGRVAAVFINRLNKKMRLQTDPTVIYSITKGKYVLERPLRTKDLQMQDEYNTYRNSGLPPGPIANPGYAAIESVTNPLKTDEIYFVADGTGGHKFAKTLSEHNRNVRKWRKISRNK